MYWFVVRPDMVNLRVHDTSENESANFEALVLHATEWQQTAFKPKKLATRQDKLSCSSVCDAL